MALAFRSASGEGLSLLPLMAEGERELAGAETTWPKRSKKEGREVPGSF